MVIQECSFSLLHFTLFLLLPPFFPIVLSFYYSSFSIYFVIIYLVLWDYVMIKN